MKEDMSKSDIKSAHKKADKLKSKPKAKKNIAKWAKEKGMDPEGAIYAIAMNQQKKESYTRDQLPQIKNKNLDYKLISFFINLSLYTSNFSLSAPSRSRNSPDCFFAKRIPTSSKHSLMQAIQ